MEIISTVASIEVLTVLAFGLVVGVVAMLAFQIRNGARINTLVDPEYKNTLEDAQNEADNIIAEAQEKARQIVSATEEESRRAIEERTNEAREANEAYIRSLRELEEHIVEKLTESADGTQAHTEEIVRAFTDYLERQEEDMRAKLSHAADRITEIPEHIEDESRAASEELRERVARAGEGLEQAIADMKEESKDHINAHLQEKIAEAEADINAYRQSRKELINNHVEVLVEDVVRIVLHKDLSVSEHVGLVRQALEDAKEMGTFSENE